MKASIKKGSPKSIELAIKLNEALSQKTEKEELTSDDYIRIAIKTRDALREELKSSGGICPLCGKLPILHGEVCVDKEREPEPEREVAEMVLPSGLGGDSPEPSGNLD